MCLIVSVTFYLSKGFIRGKDACSPVCPVDSHYFGRIFFDFLDGQFAPRGPH